MRVVEEYNLLDEKQAQAKALISQVLSDTALEVQGTAQELVPVGDTGILRSSIHTEPTGVMEWTVLTDVFYADWVEFGTGKYREATAPGPAGRDSPWVYYWPEQDRFVWTEGNMHQPYMRPAYERHYQFVKMNMKKALATL